MLTSEPKTALIDVNRASEFSGDVVDRYSKIVDLGAKYEFLTVKLPALSASGIVSAYVQEDDKVTKAAGQHPAVVGTIPLIIHVLDDDATGSFAHSTSSTAGSLSIIFRIGGYQFVRIHVASTQSGDRSIKVWGFNRDANY